MILSLEGDWRAALPGYEGPIRIPGTLDESGIGEADRGANAWHPDQSLGGGEMAGGDVIATRLTRRHTHEGAVRLSRRLDFLPPEGTRTFVEVERARCLRLFVDGGEESPFEEPSLSTPQVFEVTGRLREGAELMLLSDNSYPGLPRDDILYASAATDETQTNWNGLIGYVRLRVENGVFIRRIRAYPRGNALDVTVEISAARPYSGTLRLSSTALAGDVSLPVELAQGEHAVRWTLPLAEDARRWDEYDGQLYALHAELDGADQKSVSFGVRDFGKDAAGRLTLNGRRFFLRGEANCAVFPETGRPPMTVREWMKIMETYRAYGVNTVRFHSWCPPEAAFAAADALGMMVQPELSHWNPRDALESDAAWEYYRAELRAILREYANHPSFVMLTLGNELFAGPLGHGRMDALLALARETDGTRLYAAASNLHYGERGCDHAGDFFTGSAFRGEPLRATMAGTRETGGALPGHLNGAHPSGRACYGEAMGRLRREYGGPVFGFEVGQYEVLPDFGQLEDYRGVTDPANLRAVRDRALAKGLGPVWRDWVESTGELALLCYREEVEAALRTPAMSGLSLLGLQDFPGQGIALVGMLDSHLRPKPYPFAEPGRFAAFFRDRLPLAMPEKYAWSANETFTAEVAVANYGKSPVPAPLRWRLEGEGFSRSGALAGTDFPVGELTRAGTIEAPLSEIAAPTALELTLIAGEAVNRYPIWAYPDVEPTCPEGVVVAEDCETALSALAAGRSVFLDPPMSAPLRSVPSRFSTDFWSVGTFPWQSGTMGQWIDAAHPLFRRFPTNRHTQWQWWPMATRRAALIPVGLRCIVAQPDSYAKLRPMGQLFECRVGAGRLMFSSFALRGLTQWPEARALLAAIYDYMASEAFEPEQALDADALRGMFDA